MISKAFQDIVTQMADIFQKNFGIADSTGLILASNGQEIPEDVLEEVIYTTSDSDTDKVFVCEGYTVKVISARPYPEHYVYVEGTDEISKYCCSTLCVAADNVRRYYDEKYDKTVFIQNIIFENMLSFDLHQKALELCTLKLALF